MISDKPEYVENDEGCWIWQRYTQPAGYGVRSYHGKLHLAHRVAWIREHGEISQGMEIDHVCRVKSCVNPAHLRMVTRSQNQQNLSPNGKGGRSGRRNVSWDRGAWAVRVMLDGKSHYLGTFKSVDEADEVARAFRREHMPFSTADIA